MSGLPLAHQGAQQPVQAWHISDSAGKEQRDWSAEQHSSGLLFGQQQPERLPKDSPTQAKYY